MLYVYRGRGGTERDWTEEEVQKKGISVVCISKYFKPLKVDFALYLYQMG